MIGIALLVSAILTIWTNFELKVILQYDREHLQIRLKELRIQINCLESSRSSYEKIHS